MPSYLPFRGPPPRRVTSQLSRLLSLGLVVTAIGCGDNTDSPTAPASPPALATAAASALAFYQVSAGWNHSCGVTTDNRAYCWGATTQGALGDGEPDFPTVPQPTPVAVLGGIQFHQLSAGSFVTCGVTPDFRAYCWGDNERGEVGDGSLTNRLVPVAVAGGLRFRQIETNFSHTCGVSYPDNRAYCWGWNANGELGDGSLTNRSKPVAVLGALRFRAVSAGYYHTCGVTTDNRVFCWGLNSSGQLGDSTEVHRRTKPALVSGRHQFRQVDAGSLHNCAVTTDDRAFCWGDGRAGELGTGKKYLSFWPRAVAGGLSFTRVTAGYDHTCGEATGHRTYCWGANALGQLGEGTTTPSLKPVLVSGGLFFSQVSAGVFHTCGKTSTAVAYCWGDGFFGQLGDGTISRTSTPVAVVGPK